MNELFKLYRHALQIVITLAQVLLYQKIIISQFDTSHVCVDVDCRLFCFYMLGKYVFVWALISDTQCGNYLFFGIICPCLHLEQMYLSKINHSNFKPETI